MVYFALIKLKTIKIDKQNDEDVIYDQTLSSLFYRKLDTIMYNNAQNNAIATTGTIWSSSRGNIYQQLGFKYFKLQK